MQVINKTATFLLNMIPVYTNGTVTEKLGIYLYNEHSEKI